MIHKVARHFVNQVSKPELLVLRVESLDRAVDSLQGTVVHLVVGIHPLLPVRLVRVEHPTLEEVGEEHLDPPWQLFVLELGRLPLCLEQRQHGSPGVSVQRVGGMTWFNNDSSVKYYIYSVIFSSFNRYEFSVMR